MNSFLILLILTYRLYHMLVTYDINDMLKSIGLENYSIIGYSFYNNDDVLNPILTDIPLYEHGVELIPLDYYNTTIIPLINSLR